MQIDKNSNSVHFQWIVAFVNILKCTLRKQMEYNQQKVLWI